MQKVLDHQLEEQIQRTAVPVKGGKKAPLVDVFLWGDNCLRIRLPLSDARRHLGAAGCYFKRPPPLKQMFGLGLGLFFATFLGFYAFLFYQAWAPVAIWCALGLAMGGLTGWLLGLVFSRSIMQLGYVAWSKWDPETGTRSILPMEHSGVEIAMLPKHRRAFLVAIGEMAPTPVKKASGDNHSAPEEPEEDSLTAYIIATFSTKKLYNSLQALVQRRILAGHHGMQKVLQYASIGSIAVALLIIAALVTLVMTSDKSTGSTTNQSSPGSEVSDAKR